MSEEYLIYKKSPTRIFLNILILISILIGFYYFFIGKDLFFGFNFLFTAPLILAAPRYFWSYFGWDRIYSVNLIKFFEILFSIGFIASSFGSIWLYRVDIYFDWLVHLLIGGILAQIFSLMFLIRRPQTLKKRTATFGFYLMLPLSILWEAYEFLGDKIFGTRMFGDWFRSPLFDTAVDVGLTILGAGISAFLIYFYWYFFLKLATPKEKINEIGT